MPRSLVVARLLALLLTSLAFLALAGTASADAGGSTVGWGSGNKGKLGADSQATYRSPVRVKGPAGVEYLAEVVAVAAGDRISLARKADGSLWAWGQNGDGEMGQGTTTPLAVPAPVRVKGPGGAGYLKLGGKNGYINWQLLHRHCHDEKTARDPGAGGSQGSPTTSCATPR
jgi:hypothetical protein